MSVFFYHNLDEQPVDGEIIFIIILPRDAVPDALWAGGQTRAPLEETAQSQPPSAAAPCPNPGPRQP